MIHISPALLETIESHARAAYPLECCGLLAGHWQGETLIITRVLEAPTWQIATNAGVDGDLVVEKVKEGTGGFGFNAATGAYEDLVSAGIIDPALVARTALQNAASVAGLMLTTDVVVTELKEDDDPVEEAVS